MTQHKGLHAAWQDGVQLGHAWWAFADNRNKKRFRELQREGQGSHLGLQRSLEIDLLGRLRAGELQAFGIEEGSETDAGPIAIPQYFFLKTAEVDWDNDTLTAIGKKFYEITVQGERESPDETLPSEPAPVIDPCEISAQRERERLDETLPSLPTTSSEPHEITGQGEREPPHETLPAPSIKSRMGRPPVLPKIREVVRELIDGNEFENLIKKEIVTLIRRKAKQRFPSLFPKLTQPSINKINEALIAEGWPPPPAE